MGCLWRHKLGAFHLWGRWTRPRSPVVSCCVNIYYLCFCQCMGWTQWNTKEGIAVTLVQNGYSWQDMKSKLCIACIAIFTIIFLSSHAFAATVTLESYLKEKKETFKEFTEIWIDGVFNLMDWKLLILNWVKIIKRHYSVFRHNLLWQNIK